jgi:hypothetical protein
MGIKKQTDESVWKKEFSVKDFYEIKLRERVG